MCPKSENGSNRPKRNAKIRIVHAEIASNKPKYITKIRNIYAENASKCQIINAYALNNNKNQNFIIC